MLLGRPREAGEGSAARLAARGHEAVLSPLFEIVALAFAPPAFAPDALVITSAQAAAAAASLAHAGPVFAVGDRSAAALRAAGLADIRSAGGDGADLARLVAATLRPGSRLLLLTGRDRRPEPEASLRAGGLRVELREVYAAEPVAVLPEAARGRLAAGRLDAALHYSPRAAALAASLCEGAGLGPAFAALRHVCLSAAVAEALGPDLARRALVADAPTEGALFAALAPAGQAMLS